MSSPTLAARLRARPFLDLLSEAAVFLGLSLLLFLSGTTVGLVSFDFQLTVLVLLALVSLAWLLAPPRRLPIPLRLPLAVWIAVSVLVAALSIDPRRSFSQVALMLVSVFLFTLAAHLAARGWNPSYLTRALLWIGFIILLLGLFEVGAWYAAWLRSAPGRWLPAITYRPTSANVIAMTLNLVIFLALPRLLGARTRLARAALALYLLAAFFLLFLTSSRGGWIATAAGLAVLALLSVLSGRLRPRAAWDHLRAHPLLGLLVTLAALLAAVVLGYLLYRQAVHPTHGSFFLSRTPYWPPAWQAFLASPIHGTGQFTYATALLRHLSIPPHPVYSHAHGSPVNLLAEMGLLGAFAFAFLFLAALRALHRRWLADPAARPLLTAAAAMLAAFSVHSLFDCFQHEPFGLWLLVFTLGLVLPPSPQGEGRGRGLFSPSPQPQDTGSALFAPSPQVQVRGRGLLTRPYWLLLFLAVWTLDLWSAAPLHAGVDLANANRWPEAAAAFRQAADRDPRSVIAHQQHALAAAVLAQSAGPADLAAAVDSYRRVVALEPAFAFNHANLAALLLAQGSLPAARAEFQAAVDLAPGSPLLWFNLARAAEAAADAPAALAAYARALELGLPADSPYWQMTLVRAEAASVYLAAHPAPAPTGPDALRAALAANPNRARPYLDLAFALLPSDPAAAAALAAQAALAFTDDPADALDLAWLNAALAAARGDLPAAASLGQSALDSALASSPFGPGAFGQLQYAPRMFRRPAAAVELVPQLAPLPLSAAWTARAGELEGWYLELGQADQAAVMREQVQLHE